MAFQVTSSKEAKVWTILKAIVANNFKINHLKYLFNSLTYRQSYQSIGVQFESECNILKIESDMAKMVKVLRFFQFVVTVYTVINKKIVVKYFECCLQSRKRKEKLSIGSLYPVIWQCWCRYHHGKWNMFDSRWQETGRFTTPHKECNQWCYKHFPFQGIQKGSFVAYACPERPNVLTGSKHHMNQLIDPIVVNYIIYISTINEVLDLGVLLDPRLTLISHYAIIIKSAF